MENTAIINAIQSGILAGGDESDWDAPEFETARVLTADAGCSWDFTGWKDAISCLQYGQLGGVQFTGSEPFTGLDGYQGR